mgnify:FL=1
MFREDVTGKMQNRQMEDITPAMLEHDIELLERARSVLLKHQYWLVGGVSYADMASAIDRRIAELTERLERKESNNEKRAIGLE